jgi:5-oxopent-3-ene-1,2,5-tricarboxylate decarboxylase/2-hydroxyhepta-2,4-diene-1,7-dioate isomerase
MSAAPFWLPQGTVYGALLNFRREYDLWAPKMTAAPHQAAPKAPVLYIKTANTFAPSGAAVAVPGEVELGATLGLVMGGYADAPGSLGRVAGCVLLDDISLPHASYYRPPMRYRNRDGFLVCGSAVQPLAGVDLNALRIDLRVNGALVQTVDLQNMVRSAAALLADVNEFMTLQAGDVLMLGSDCLPDGSRPRARAGDRIEISAPGFAPLSHSITGEQP